MSVEGSVRCFIVLALLAASSPVWAALPSHPLIDKAKKDRGPRVEYALQNGAEAYLTPDGKTYYLLWFPEGTDPQNPPPMIATMHGHASYAFEDFHVWHRFLKERGYGLLAVQWWLGEGESINDYLHPDEIYRIIDEVFREHHVKPGTAMLHGFSRGSANIYPVAALDRSLGTDYFVLFVANAGRANSDYPPVRQIEEGQYGEMPLKGSHWVTFSGGKDTNPARDGFPAMRETADWIRRYGGTVDLAIEDPGSGHGGFHMNPKNTYAALDVFDKRRAKSAE